MKDLDRRRRVFRCSQGRQRRQVATRSIQHATSDRRPILQKRADPAKERNVILEMKLIADVGLVGFPNVGKSYTACLLRQAHSRRSRITTSRRSIRTWESYRFMTRSFVMADIAGIMEGAQQGAGTGPQIPEAYRKNQSPDPRRGCFRKRGTRSDRRF